MTSKDDHFLHLSEGDAVMPGFAATPTPFTVRPPRPDDIERWRELYRGYADFYREPVTDAQLDLVWSWISDPHHDVKGVLVRDASGTAVGLAHYRPYFRPPVTLTTSSLSRPHEGMARSMRSWTPCGPSLVSVVGARSAGSPPTTTTGRAASTTRSPSAPCGSPTTCRSRRPRSDPHNVTPQRDALPGLLPRCHWISWD